MSDSTKEVIIKELKTLVKKENLSIDNMIEMLNFAKTWELILFKRSIDRILKEWKHYRPIPKITAKKKVVNL